MTTFNTLLRDHQFLVIGHRGAAALAPENTLESFQTALQWGCVFLELDVYVSQYADGRKDLVVIHDAKLDRTTNGRGALSNYTIEQLRQFDAGNGQQIPLLEEVVTLLREHIHHTRQNVGLNIELKGPGTAAPVAALLTQLEDLPVLISSFDHHQLYEVRELAPQAPLAPLYDRYRSDWLDTAKALDAQTINLSARIANTKRIAQMNQAGYPVLVYTVNSVAQGFDLLEMGAAGLFTDRPDKLMAVVPPRS